MTLQDARECFAVNELPRKLEDKSKCNETKDHRTETVCDIAYKVLPPILPFACHDDSTASLLATKTRKCRV